MSLRLSSTLGLRLLKESFVGFLSPTSNSLDEIVRHRRAKHWNPKFKWMRRAKVIKVDLPNFQEDVNTLSEEEIRSKLKERGIMPARPYVERQFFISSTGGVFEPYVPPEGDGKVSVITPQGAKQKLQFLEKKSKSMMAVRKIRQFDEDFNWHVFLKEAEDIYKKMHECLVNKDEETIQQYVTERAFPEVMHNVECKTIRWRFIENIELPYVVHARCTDVITKENIFAQVTVRFHTKQSLAVYDRFGRLMHGSEILAKDVLEYVVFEKHLANQYGKWRVHHKIIPDWMPPKEPTKVTFIKQKEPEKPLTAKDAVGDKSVIEETVPKIESGEKLVTA